MRKPEYTITKAGCWECTSHRLDISGYPIGTFMGKWDRMHRHFYRLYHGEIENSMVVRHTCDNRICINPDHLELGTHADNVRDRVARGRSARGVQNGRSKLNESQVIEILKSSLPVSALANQYKVSIRAIQLIKERKNWAWVQVGQPISAI